MKLIIIDDDPIVSMSLQTILEKDSKISVLATGKDGSEALSLYRQHHPDILLMDIRMKGKNGIDAGREVIEYDTQARIVYLTTFSDSEYIHDAIHIGAKGYLLKQDFASIILALDSIMAGQVVFGSELIPQIQTLKPAFKNQNQLSEREIDLLSQIAKGYNNKELAQYFDYSEGTIRNQISLLLEKLELRDRTQLVIYYFNHLK